MSAVLLVSETKWNKTWIFDLQIFFQHQLFMEFCLHFAFGKYLTRTPYRIESLLVCPDASTKKPAMGFACFRVIKKVFSRQKSTCKLKKWRCLRNYSLGILSTLIARRFGSLSICWVLLVRHFRFSANGTRQLSKTGQTGPDLGLQSLCSQVAVGESKELNRKSQGGKVHTHCLTFPYYF